MDYRDLSAEMVKIEHPDPLTLLFSVRVGPLFKCAPPPVARPAISCQIEQQCRNHSWYMELPYHHDRP